MTAGDPELCTDCQAILNKDSKLSPMKDKEDTYEWICEFCNKKNEVCLDSEEIPKANVVNYLVEAAAQVQDKKIGGAEQDISVVFCIDISGSMCVTEAVEGKHQIRGDKQKDLNS